MKSYQRLMKTDDGLVLVLDEALLSAVGLDSEAVIEMEVDDLGKTVVLRALPPEENDASAQGESANK